MQKLLCAASAAVAAYWSGAQLAVPDGMLLPGSLALGWVAAVLAGWCLAEPPALLAWDGAAWSLRGGGEALPGRPAPMLDLGNWMLVRFVFHRQDGTPGHRTRWLPLSRRDVGPAWLALRVALHDDRAAAEPGPAA